LKATQDDGAQKNSETVNWSLRTADEFDISIIGREKKDSAVERTAV
jgi:hypothetical protein